MSTKAQDPKLKKSDSKKALASKQKKNSTVAKKKSNEAEPPKPRKSAKESESLCELKHKFKAILQEDEEKHDIIQICQELELPEDHNFISFTHNKFLSSDDLVSRAFVGSEIVSIKKGSEYIKEKLTNYSSKYQEKISTLSHWSENISSYSKNSLLAFEDIKTKITASFHSLIKIIEEKQKDLTESAERLFKSKADDLEVLFTKINSTKYDMTSIKQFLDKKVAKLEDNALCQYFVLKAADLQNLFSDFDIEIFSLTLKETKKSPSNCKIYLMKLALSKKYSFQWLEHFFPRKFICL